MGIKAFFKKRPSAPQRPAPAGATDKSKFEALPLKIPAKISHLV